MPSAQAKFHKKLKMQLNSYIIKIIDEMFGGDFKYEKNIYFLVVVFCRFIEPSTTCRMRQSQKYTGHTVSFEIFDGRVSVASQKLQR